MNRKKEGGALAAGTTNADTEKNALVLPRRVILTIGSLSLTAVLFLLWLIYGREAPAGRPDTGAFLPGLNATMNALGACCLGLGYWGIRKGNLKLHIGSMITATAFSALFLVGYIVHHSIHGDTPFLAQGAIRQVYFATLISHIAVTIAALPMILIVLYLALTRRFSVHRRWARWTLPLWFYASVTGVAIFGLLRAFNAQ
jgi:putative membrane protein